jgi:ribosomal protein S18 acetylase RimI-like enzyme
VKTLIRYIKPEDFPSLITLNLSEHNNINTSSLQKLTKEELFELSDWWSHIDILYWYYNQLRLVEGDILIAIDDKNNIIGQLDFVIENNFKPYRLHIFWLYVAKPFRRQGIARKLIKQVFTIAKNRKIDLVVVESEDTKSENLYQSLGKIHQILSNFSFQFTDELNIKNLKLNLNLKPDISHTLHKLYSKLLTNKYQRIIGQYDIPTFDLLKLLNSHNSVVESIIWGSKIIEEIGIYVIGNDEFIVFFTQFLRVYSKNTSFSYDNLREVLGDAIIRIFKHGFISINLQIYEDKLLRDVILSLGFTEDDESNDPLYSLNF